MSETPQALEQIRGTVGLWTFAHETVPLDQAGEVARLIESLGFSAMWIPETLGREALTSAQLLLGATDSLVVATGIASIWARGPLATANAAKTVSAASGSRFILGLGVSHQPMVEGVHGQTYERPLAAMTSFLDALDASTMLSPEANERVPRLLAALGPKMLELSATKADGALPYLVTPAHTAFAREALGPDAFLAVEQAVALTEDPDEFALRARQHLEMYNGLPNYEGNWRRLGFDDQDFIPGGSPRLQDALVAHGTIDAIAQRVTEHFDAGADHVCLQVLGHDLFATPAGDWEALAALAARR